MSRRPISALPPAPSTAPDCGIALRAERQAALRRGHRPGPHRRPGGRDPRPRRQPLLRQPPWRHHPVLRARLPAHGDLRAHRRQPLGWPSTAHDNLVRVHRRHGALSGHAASARSTSSPTRPTAAALRSSTIPACGSPTISTSPPTGASSSARPRSASKCTNGPVDALEARGNGRIICYDPRNGKTHTGAPQPDLPERHLHRRDGESFLFAETWGCRVKRYWFDGPKKGRPRS